VLPSRDNNTYIYKDVLSQKIIPFPCPKESASLSKTNVSKPAELKTMRTAKNANAEDEEVFCVLSTAQAGGTTRRATVVPSRGHDDVASHLALPLSEMADTSEDADVPAPAAEPTRDEQARAARRRMLDDSLGPHERMGVGPMVTLDAGSVRRQFKALAVLLHPDKHPADTSEAEQRLWTEAYLRLGRAKTALLRAMGCEPSAEDEDDDEEARALVAEGRTGEATVRYRRVATELTSELGSRHPRTHRAKLRLAGVLRTCPHQVGEAEVLYRWLHRTARDAFGTESVDYLQTSMGLGLLLHQKGQLEAAEPLLREGADGLSAIKGASDVEALTSRAAHAALLESMSHRGTPRSVT
jgi:hypothetical protein